MLNPHPHGGEESLAGKRVALVVSLPGKENEHDRQEGDGVQGESRSRAGLDHDEATNGRAQRPSAVDNYTVESDGLL